MSEENNEMVNLGDLGSASSADIRKALKGQPSPVEDDQSAESAAPQETQTPKESGTKLGDFENSLIANEDGSFKLVNPYSTNLDVDLDQFETQRRRVSEGSMLSGILNGVEGLEQNFTYTGLESTAKRSEEAQGVVNKMKNGMTQLVADTAINVGQGFASLLYGVPSAIVNGDLTKLYDNTVANSMDRGTEFLDEFYKIKRGGDQSGLQKTANFLFDDLAGGASFVMGAIATEMAFTALTAATFGGAAPAQVAASAGIVARGTRLVQKALQGGKALMAGRLVDDALRGARALGQQTTRQAATAALRTAAETARNPMAMQAAARVGRQLITGASMESGMEARHMLNAAVETQKQQHEQLFGEGTFTEEMGNAFRDEISGYADGVFGVNMALVGASNMLMFPKLFGVGMRRGMRTSKFIDTSTLSSKARARLAKNLGVTEGKLPKLVDAARGNTWGRIAGRGGTTGRVTAANMKNAAYEGFVEEGGQGAISRTTEDYIAKRYDPKNVEKTANFTESFLEGLKGSYTTKDGFKEIGIGMLLAFTGVPMYARAKNADGSAKWQWQMMGGYADQRKELLARDAKANAIIELSEKNGDVGGILRAEVANFHRQNGLQRDQDVAIAEGRFKDAKDIESEMIFSHAAAKVVTGRYDQSIAEAEQIMEEMSADEFREQYGDAGKNMTDAEVQQRKAQVLEKHKQRMQAAREAYDMAGEIYRGEDPDIHTGVAHMVYMAQEKDLREKAIAEEMAGAIEGMNADQILDLVRAQEDLNLTDEHLGEILKRINRNKDIEKQLKTKLERKIIKNVDQTKAEQRNKEVEDLQREQEENLNYMQNLMDAMATAQNVDRNKYDFSDESFLADLAQLHAFISLQNENVAFQKADLEQLQADLRAVAADRKVLIANYNDFISPGGVQRFEERMIGSIEALAKMSAEERQEEKQDAAQEETVEEMREEENAPVADPEQEDTDVPDGPPGATPTGEVVDPVGAPEANPETGNFGFPDPTPPTTAVPDEAPGAEGTTETPDGVPQGMGLGDEGGTGQPNEPAPTPQQPAQPEVGQLRLVLINARHPDNDMGREANAMALRKVLSGIPVGTKLTLRLNENESGVDVLTPDGVRIDTIRNAPGSKRLDRLSPAVKNLILANGEVTVVTTTALDPSVPGPESGMAFLGGEKVVSIDPSTGRAVPENPNLDRTVEGVLGESFDKVVTGFGVMSLDGEILAMQDLETMPYLTVHPVGDVRFAGNAYISTKDANGVSAYHSIQLAPFGQGRATQILDVIDAYNQFVTNPSEMTAAQKMAFTTWATVNGIDYKTLKGKELRRAVQRPLRRLISSDLASAQKEKVAAIIRKGRFSRPYFSVEVTGKGKHTLTIVTQQAQGKKALRQFSHNKEGVRNPQTLIRENLAAHRMNVTKESVDQQVPNGDGTYTAMDARAMIKEHGSFGDRMPFFLDGKMYNRVPVSIGIALEALTPVPTGRSSQGGRVVGDNAALLAQKKQELGVTEAQLNANRELLKEEQDKPHGTKLDEPLVKYYQKEIARLEALVDTLEKEIADLESPDNPPPSSTPTGDLFVDQSGIEGIDWDNFDMPGGMSTSALLDDAYLDSLSDQEYYRLMAQDTLDADEADRMREYDDKGIRLTDPDARPFDDVPDEYDGPVDPTELSLRDLTEQEVNEDYAEQLREADDKGIRLVDPDARPIDDVPVDGPMDPTELSLRELTEQEVNEDYEEQLREADDKGIRVGNLSSSALIDEDHMKRAGALYNVPGLNSRQLRDGINFSRGVMARAFVTHIRTVDRRKPVKADYLRRTVRATLEAQLKALEQAPKNPAVNAAIEAHKAYLSPKVFNRLMDLAMVELLREATGVIQLRGTGSLESALQKLGETQQDRVNEENENAAELSENPMAAFDDNFAFGVDPGSTLRLEAKLMLMSLIDKQNNNADAVGLAGRRFVDVKSLMGKLNAVLAGTEPSYEAVEARLEEWVGTYPEFRAVLDALSMEKAVENLPPNKRGDANAIKQSMAIQDMIRNQFVNYAVKEATTFDSVKIIRQQVDLDNPMGGVAADIQIWNSNSRNMKDHVRSDMRSILVQHGFFDIQGNLVPEKFTDLRKKIDDIADLPTADQAQALRDVLHRELGIVVPVTALTEANQTKDRKGNRFFKNIAKVLGKKTMLGGGLGRFKEALTTISKSDMTLEDLLATKKKDGKTANREGQNMVDFFVALADYRPNFIQNSSKDGDNKTRWHYSAPKLLHQMLRTIKGNPQDHLMGGRIGMLQAEDQDLVGITYLSGIKLENRGKERDFHKMEAGDRVVAQLAMYGNKRLYRYEDRGEDKVMISKFLMPTLADKQTMPILQAPAMSAKQAGIKLQEGLDKKPWRQVQITDVVKSVKGVYDASAVKKSIDLEVDRIMRIQAADFKGMTAAQRQAVGFVTAPALNRLAENFIEGKISRKEFRKMVHREAVQEYEAALTADLQHMLEQSEGTIWREANDESGTIGRLEHFNVGKAKYAFVKDHVGPNADFEIGGMDKVAFLAFVGKYAIDSMDARTSIVNDTMGDLGAFVKVDKQGKVRVAKTATNLGKRFAALIAPGNAIPYVQYRNAKGDIVNNHRVNFLVMPARVVDKASHYTYLERLGQTPDELAMQEGYDSADAAEYTTVEEHLSILYAEGKITRREMAGLLGKISRGEKLDNAELGWFQPMKPVTTARVGDHMLYVKSASFPLVPQLTQGTELDKLRVFLEDNNIQRAAYDSAVKLGNEWSDVNDENATDEQKMVPIHDGANVVIDAEALGQRVIRGVDRKFMRIQQQVPVGKAKEKIHGSQVAKLLLVDLADAKFELDGQKLTGREMYKEYIEARDAELTYRLQLFADKYGLAIENGKVYHTPESRKKFAARIVEEGVARGYDANELAHLHFDPATGRFTTPLEGGPSQERVENLIKAILFKEIYEPSIEGFSGPIRPEVGIKTLDDNEVDKSDIMWIKRKGKKVFDGKKLKVAKGKQMDQIIMPWKYKASLEKYMDEDGNIDADNLPPELLKVFAYRIPGQRKSSSVAFEIVGFLPEQYGDTLIVNEELVGRIGQDYDIDKMFGFLYSIRQRDNGDIEVIRRSDEMKKAPKKAGPINVYYGAKETSENTRILSNLAERRFTYDGVEYGSVEHAYQTLKSGEFDQATYDKYQAINGFGKKIRGKSVTKDFDNLALMENLVVASFQQNPDSEAVTKLLSHTKFTHNTNTEIDKAFLRGLRRAQREMTPLGLRGKIAAERNHQIDIYIASMTSQDKAVQRAIHAPVTDGYGEQLGDQISLLRNPETAVGMPMSQSYNAGKADAARSAKASIGVMATHNVLHSQLEQALAMSKDVIPYLVDEAGDTIGFVEILGKRSDKPSEEIESSKFVGAGEIHDDTFLLTYTQDGKEYTPQAGNKSDQFSRLLNHAVDNENNGLLDKLGITADTWPIWTGLTHMGYNQETIAIFVAMPGIQKYLEMKSKSRRLGDNSRIEISDAMFAVADGILEDDDFQKIQVNLNKEDMLAMVQGRSDLSEKEQAMMNFQALSALQTLEGLGRDLRNVQTHMKMDTNRPKSVVAVQVAIAEMKQAAKKAGKADQSISVRAALKASQNTVAGTVSSLVESTFSQLADVDGNLLPQSVINELVADLKRAGNPGDIAEQVTTLVKGAKSLRYAAFTEKFAGKTAQEVREEAHNVETGGIAKRLMEMRKAHPELLDNAFLRQLVAVNHPGSYPHVEFPGDRQLEANPIEVQRAFLDLLRSSDPEIRAFAKDLVSYALATSGGRLKSRGFLKYVPAEYLQANGLQEFVTSEQIAGHLENRINLQEILRHNPDLAPNYKKGSPESKGAFKMHQGTMLVRMSSPNFRGFVRISGKLYVPAGAPIELTTDGFTERFYPLERKPVTELGDYLMDEYTTGALPLDQKRPARIPARTGMSFDATMTTGPHVHNEAPGEANHNVPDIGIPEPPTEVPTGPPAGMSLGGNNEFSPDGIPAGMGLGENNEAPKKGVHDKIARNPSVESKGPNDFKTFLQKGTLRTNAFLQTLADAQNTLPADKRLKVKIVDSMETRGLYDPNNHTMYIRKDSVNNSRVVTHEAMHAVTQLGIEIAEGNLKISDKAMEKKLKDAVKEIRSLFAVAMSEENLKKMGLKHSEVMRARRGWKAFEKSQRGENLTEEQQSDLTWLKQNVDKYYGTINLKEFIAEAFSNKDFAERLAKISANRPKTFVQRLMDAVAKALKAIGIDMGRNSQFVQEIYLATMGLADLQTRGGIGVDTRASAPVSALMDAVNEPDLGGFGVQGLQELKDYKEKRIRQFEELKSRYKDNREFVRRVEARLVQERKELAVMTDDSVKVTPDYLLAVGQRELDFARRTIESVDATDPEIDMALSALENIYSVVEFYDQAREIMSDPTLKEVATELRREAAELRDNYLEKARTILREDAMRQFAGTGVNVDADTFEALQERGFLSSRFMDASRQGTTELAFLDKIVRDASQKQRAEFNDRARRYMDKSNEMKKGAYFKKHGWNGFVELDADGNPTPNMISMLSGRYESENRQKYAELGNTKAFYDWRNSVTERINIDAIFDYSGDVVKRKKNPKYVAYLEKKFGKAGAEEFLRRQESMLQEYIDNRQSEFDILELTDKDPETAKQDWVNKNDPMLAYRRAEGKQKGVKGSTSRFLLNMPLRVVNGQSTGYYDSRFEEMMEDPSALEFYNEYRQQMREMVGMLPAHKLKRDVHLAKAGLFIPAISRSLTNDLLSRNGFLDAVGRLPDSIKASMTIDPEFDVNKLIDPVTGRPRQELPTYFLGQVDPETQEYDMDRSFLAFTMMATTYDSKNAIEDKVRMTRSVMSNARVVSGKKSLAERALNRMGFEAAPGYRDAASRETTMKLVDTVVDTFYGYRTAKDPTMDAPRSMWTKKQLAEIEKLEDELELAEDQEKKDAIQKKIDEKTPKLSAGKAVTGVQQFVQAKGMAWNIPAAIVNMIFGSLSVFKHSAGRSDFSEADARKATGLMMHSSLNNMTLNTGATQTGTALKIQNAMINLDVLKDFTEMRYDVRKFVKQAGESGVNQAARQGFNKLRMYEIQRSSEYFVYGQATIAMLLSEKIDGVSLWELMGEDGVIDIDGWRPGEPNFIKLMNKVDQVNKRIHGNYDPNSPIAIKKTLLGRLLMQFRSWLPEAVATRFEQEKYDPYLDRAVKGTYITMFSKEWRQNWAAMMPMLLPAWARTKNMDTMKEEISAVDQENIRKFGASFRHYLQVMILIQLLRALKDDEDEEQSLRMLNFGLNLMDRVENDLALFGRPGAFLDMTQGDFLAVIGAMSDAEKLMEATVLTVQGDAYIETGVYAGTPRMWHYTKKLTPHLGAVQRVVNNLDRELGS